jgi:hypothetical protein
MIRIPTKSPQRDQLLTTLAGAALAALGYFFPALTVTLAPLGKALWASGLFTAGAGAVQMVNKAEGP